MPHYPEDERHPHLPLTREDVSLGRRKHQVPPARPPARGGRKRFAEELNRQIIQIEQQAATRPVPPAGIQPHLVFRIPLAATASPQAMADMLAKIGVTVVSIEKDKAVIAFSNDTDLSQFHKAVAKYQRGPTVDRKTGKPRKSTQWDVFEHIEASQMRLWGRLDRIGSRLAESIGPTGELIVGTETYVLDVDVWHRGTIDLARASLEELRRLIQHNSAEVEKLTDSFVGELLCVARVRVRGEKLSQLLNLDAVAEIEFPPQPVFDPRQAARSTSADFPTPPLPPQDGPHLCVVDSGITSNHPLLSRNVGHAEAILTSGETSADENGHGTIVAGIAVFGDVRACYGQAQFASPVTLFSARVLNADNRFDDELLIIQQMRRAIDFFTASPYNCRVFNLSLGVNEAWLPTNPRQSLWAESLDTIAREFGVLLVVSAGNQDVGWSPSTAEAEQIAVEYPRNLFVDECGLCQPATAAIAITVGGIADSESPAIPPPGKREDIVRTIAAINQPMPTTRIGPGLNGAIKPEFVAAAGNVAFQGFSMLRNVTHDQGLAVMSLSNEPTKQLFAYDIGTSFAAPRVARTAAMLWINLRNQLAEEPQANLVRAMLAASASPPDALRDFIEPLQGEEGVRRVCGYGAIDEEFAFESADRRVTLVAQGTLAIDTFAVFELPSLLQFRQAPGYKKVTVTLAYDPPVRRRRADYLGVRMNYALIRGKSLAEVVDAYRHFTTEEQEAMREAGDDVPKAFQGSFKCDLRPGLKALQASTLQRSCWKFKSEKRDYGEVLYLIVRAQRLWAPESFTDQDFAVTVTLEAEEPQLYNLIRNRVQLRQRQRARPRR